MYMNQCKTCLWLYFSYSQTLLSLQLSLSEKTENQQMLGLEQIPTSPDNFFYNEFISRVLFNRDVLVNSADPSLKTQQCLHKLDKVALVKIEMTSHDAVFLRRYVDLSFSKVSQSIGRTRYYSSLL